jgi:hypothetical protein
VSFSWVLGAFKLVAELFGDLCPSSAQSPSLNSALGTCVKKFKFVLDFFQVGGQLMISA